MGDGKDAYRVLVGKPEVRRPLGRPRRRWEDVKWIFKKSYGEAWTGLIWLRICAGSRGL